jgi:hypothetical protein
MVRCTGACHGPARGQCLRLVLAPVVPRVLAPRDLSQYTRMRHKDKNSARGAKSMMHDQEQLTQVNPYKLFTTLPLAFLTF